jgi:hypothetical protein
VSEILTRFDVRQARYPGTGCYETNGGELRGQTWEKRERARETGADKQRRWRLVAESLSDAKDEFLESRQLMKTPRGEGEEGKRKQQKRATNEV